MRWWLILFIGSLWMANTGDLAILLQVQEHTAHAIPKWLMIVSILAIGIGMVRKVMRYYSLNTDRLASKIGARLDIGIPVGFLSQFTAAPWLSWSRAGERFHPNRLLRSWGQSPPFLIFDVEYLEKSSSSSNLQGRVTFIVIPLSATPAGHVPIPGVPKGFTAVASHGLLYFYRSTSWMFAGDYLPPVAIPDALDQARAVATQAEAIARLPAPPPFSGRPSLLRRSLAKARPLLQLLACALVIGAWLTYERSFPHHTLVMQMAVLLAALGNTWRRDRHPAWSALPLTCWFSLEIAGVSGLIPLPSHFHVLGGILSAMATVLMALFGVSRLSAGLQVALLSGAAFVVYGVKEGNAMMFYGVPVAFSMILLQGMMSTSAFTKRNSARKLEWKDGWTA
jgi:hypothetical protein